jgi:D-sedoheptulose 7-phosphate isomerase
VVKPNPPDPDIFGHLKAYIESLTDKLKSVSPQTLKMAFELLRSHKERVFIAGNGGSASIAEHSCIDYLKGANLPFISLTANTSVITAIANDNGYEHVFSTQLKTHNLKSTDLLVLISSSGNSPNIVKAAEYAKFIGTPIMAFTGFDGGRLKTLADLSFHIPINNYGIAEDAHQIIMHVLTQSLRHG